jgi:hypothetical protein
MVGTRFELDDELPQPLTTNAAAPTATIVPR